MRTFILAMTISLTACALDRPPPFVPGCRGQSRCGQGMRNRDVPVVRWPGQPALDRVCDGWGVCL
jgi:hypothetical protein